MSLEIDDMSHSPSWDRAFILLFEIGVLSAHARNVTGSPQMQGSTIKLMKGHNSLEQSKNSGVSEPKHWNAKTHGFGRLPRIKMIDTTRYETANRCSTPATREAIPSASRNKVKSKPNSIQLIQLRFYRPGILHRFSTRPLFCHMPSANRIRLRRTA